jgi:hypothetical protein
LQQLGTLLNYALFSVGIFTLKFLLLILLISWKKELLVMQSSVDKEISPRDNLLNVDRASPMESLARAMRRRNFTPLAKLDIAFVDVENKAEGAVDNGGPTREFFRLLLREIQNCELLEGPENSKNLRMSAKGNAMKRKYCFLHMAVILH